MNPRPALAAAIGVAALTGLAGCAATTANAATPAASVSPGPVTTGTPAPAAPTSAAPALKNTGTAWPTVLGSMIAYGQWLLANPNPALATTIAEPGCAAANDLTAELQSLVDQNAYVRPIAPVLTLVIGPSPSGTSTVGSQTTVQITATRASEPILGRKTKSTTRVLSNRAQLPTTSLSVTLLLGTDKHWRFCTITDPNGDPDGDATTTLF
jgi:hypothetical protein